MARIMRGISMAKNARWTRFGKRTIVEGRTEKSRNIEEGRWPMGDKGGKKDKAKDQKQKEIKQQQEAKRKLDKQPKKQP
jgi:hypothetical protein